MLDFADITIIDKALFGEYLGRLKSHVSELSFTNLFMWRNFYKIRYTIINNFLCIISVPESNEPFAFMPAGDLNQDSFSEAVTGLKSYFESRGWKLKFKRIEEDKLEYFKEFTKHERDIVFDRDNSDYIYMAEDLIKLGGKKLDSKRNHINKFKKLYEYEYVELNKSYMEECHRIMAEWCAERDCKDHGPFYCERLANMELLNNFDVLACKGALIKVNGRFEAFTVGEMLNADTAVIHIEKANSKVNGLYTFINQQFCEKEWQNAAYINREQDLGVEGLRKAKLSYNPLKLINKYTINIV